MGKDREWIRVVVDKLALPFGPSRRRKGDRRIGHYPRVTLKPTNRDLDAFFRGKAVCERHPNKPWPHDDCAGPGMPPPNEKARDAIARRR